eukprot:5152840-Pleurochrysis_carterae.AAC.3
MSFSCMVAATSGMEKDVYLHRDVYHRFCLEMLSHLLPLLFLPKAVALTSHRIPREATVLTCRLPALVAYN